MPVYVYQCEKCKEIYDDMHKWGEDPSPCPACGESEELKKIPTKPRSPKIQSGKPADRWGYNKTTTDYWFDGEGRRDAYQYDENKRKSQVKEMAEKHSRKGATVSINKPKKT